MTVLRVFPRRGADEEERGDIMAEKEAQRENMSGEGSSVWAAAGEALQQGLAFPRKPYLKLLGQSSEQER